MARKLQESANADVWRQSYSRDELLEMRKQLAKAANQRMVRLENSKSEVTGEDYTFGAYDIAKDWLDRNNRNRFSEVKDRKDLNVFDLRKEINVLQNFINSKSSRVGGMRQIEKARIEIFEEKGIKFASNKEFYDFLRSNSFMELSGNAKKKNGDYYTVTIDSDIIIDMYNRYRDKGATPEQLQNALNDFRRAKGKKSEKRLERYFKSALKKSGNK